MTAPTCRWARPLARLDTDAIAQRVIDAGTLAEVTVAPVLAARTVVIRASLRQPVVAFRNPQGQVKVADKDGVVYATVSTAPAGRARHHGDLRRPRPRTPWSPPSRCCDALLRDAARRP